MAVLNEWFFCNYWGRCVYQLDGFLLPTTRTLQGADDTDTSQRGNDPLNLNPSLYAGCQTAVPASLVTRYREQVFF